LVRAHPTTNTTAGTIININENGKGITLGRKYISRHHDTVAITEVNAVITAFTSVLINDYLAFCHVTP
jgi:hypothetical protein